MSISPRPPTDQARQAREGDEMRRFLTIPAAGVLALALAVPAMAGANVGNTSGSTTIAQGSGGTFDDSTGTYRYGYVAVSRDGAGGPAYVEYGSPNGREGQNPRAGTPHRT